MATFKKLLAEAAEHIGKREKPSGSNLTEFSKDFGRIPGYPSNGYGYPWCQAFQSVIAKRVGMKPNVDYPHTASCTAAAQWYRRRNRLFSKPKVGDQILYTRDGGKTFYHVGLVVAIDGNKITTIEGNTSGSFKGNYWNGDGVYKKTHTLGSKSARFGRSYYETEPKPTPATPPKNPLLALFTREFGKGDMGLDVMIVQQALTVKGYLKGEPDGEFGPLTDEAVKRFQKASGLDDDGVVGPQTLAKLFP